MEIITRSSNIIIIGDCPLSVEDTLHESLPDREVYPEEIKGLDFGVFLLILGASLFIFRLL